MRTGLVIVSLLGLIAGCGGSSKGGGSAGGTGGGSAGGTGGGGTAGGGGTSVSPDLATPAAPVDMAQLSCSDLLSDACQASQDAFNACIANASSKAKMLLQAFFTCVQTTCANEAGDDAGTSPCSTADECFDCVQSGTSPTGAPNGTCTNGSATATGDALCGKCADQILACGADM